MTDCSSFFIMLARYMLWPCFSYKLCSLQNVWMDQVDFWLPSACSTLL